MLKNFPRQKLSDKNCRGELKEFFAEYETSRYRFELCQKNKIKFVDFKKRSPRVAAVLQAIYDERKPIRENREKIYSELFDKKIITTAFDEETALKFLKDYYEIRRKRNQVNHANAQATKTISDLKPMIENYLTALEKIPAI